ncbi:hypothetical protein IPZ61_15710 [Streptomyces sioyaensis]|uniref:hypothetical protein n=1 Tax=Streptomyces sioyaensis TaxID=67364 RepID=UPI001F3C1BD3|nr:hypothetical protein [Streptomyces sioyaensis]MCF3174764.1 hypothetical protein [Streptomyces sioyaensis]
MVHAETIKRVVDVVLVEGEEGFVWVNVEVITTGNVRKVVKFPHYNACYLRSKIQYGLEGLPSEVRKRSWSASIDQVKRWLKK